MASDAMDQLMKAIMKAEKQYGDNHQYRHVFGALREARYAASRVSGNANYESPGRRAAQDASGKAVVPEAEDARNPTVPAGSEEPDGNSSGEGSTS